MYLLNELANYFIYFYYSFLSNCLYNSACFFYYFSYKFDSSYYLNPLSIKSSSGVSDIKTIFGSNYSKLGYDILLLGIGLIVTFILFDFIDE